jgi:hypothetical protein
LPQLKLSFAAKAWVLKRTQPAECREREMAHADGLQKACGSIEEWKKGTKYLAYAVFVAEQSNDFRTSPQSGKTRQGFPDNSPVGRNQPNRSADP